MNKTILFLIAMGLSPLVSAQTKEELNRKFQNQQIQNELKFESYTQKNNITNPEEKQYLKSNLAGFAGDQPVYWKSDDIKANRGANLTTLQNGTMPGLSGLIVNGAGQNIIVMDGGRVFEKNVDFGADGVGGSSSRVFDMEGGNAPYASHPTNCAGIIASQGTTNSNTIGVLNAVAINSYSFSTTPAGTNYVKLNSAPNANISNHSYGINLGWSARTGGGWNWVSDYSFSNEDTWSGSYGSQDANFDQIVYSNPNQVVVKSAGNYDGDGPSGSFSNAYKEVGGSYVPFTSTDIIPANNCSLNFNCIGWGSLAKNIIVVGATNFISTLGNVYTSPSSVTKASFSSAGPRKDGAIKPDISAVGTGFSMPTYSNSTVYDSYSTNGTGTSYSGPIIAGIAGALTQIKRSLSSTPTFTFKGDEMKALLTHTAQEAGADPGPDVAFGWGFADAKGAAQLLIDNQNTLNTFQRRTLTSGVTYTRVVKAVAGKPMKVSISWIDPAGTPFTSSNDMQNNRSSMIVNDMDLKIVDMVTNQEYFPWKLDAANPVAAATKGNNTVDNIEQVLIDAPVADRLYRIEVSNKGTLVNASGTPTPQNYAFIITGYDSTFNLGTTETNYNNLISVYPTIVEDYATVVIPGKAKTISVYDTSGKLLQTIKAKNQQLIDFTHLPSGVYIISIDTGKGIVTKRVIKN